MTALPRNQIFVKSSEEMSELPDCSIDSLVTDPPAGISFMGKTWDGAKGGRDQWIAWLEGIMREAYRVLKPGAHGLVWALPRTSHWTATALENAGFEVRDVVCHLFGSGFPKSLNVAKQIDGKDGRSGFESPNSGKYGGDGNGMCRPGTKRMPNVDVEIESSAAKAWHGWGTALKPSAEYWILVRKPIGEKNVAANVLKHGTGAINIDESRIEYQGDRPSQDEWNRMGSSGAVGANGYLGQVSSGMKAAYADGKIPVPSGRWPSHVVLSHNPDCVQIGDRTVGNHSREGGEGKRDGGFYDVGSSSGDGKPAGRMYGEEKVPVYRCSDGCAVAELDRQSGETQSSDSIRRNLPSESIGTFKTGFRETLGHADTGGASRFFWVAKPSTSEKNANISDDLPALAKPLMGEFKDNPGRQTPKSSPTARRNHRPTVKPVDLMCYLIRMITPPGGIVLDCFAGSGTTLIAAESMGFSWIGYEMSEEYAAIALARLSQRSLFNIGETA